MSVIPMTCYEKDYIKYCILSPVSIANYPCCDWPSARKSWIEIHFFHWCSCDGLNESRNITCWQCSRRDFKKDRIRYTVTVLHLDEHNKEWASKYKFKTNLLYSKKGPSIHLDAPNLNLLMWEETYIVVMLHVSLMFSTCVFIIHLLNCI